MHGNRETLLMPRFSADGFLRELTRAGCLRTGIEDSEKPAGSAMTSAATHQYQDNPHGYQ
jgi:hypothetical protein